MSAISGDACPGDFAGRKVAFEVDAVESAEAALPVEHVADTNGPGGIHVAEAAPVRSSAGAG